MAVVMGIVASVFGGGIRIWSQGEDTSQQAQQFRFFRYKLGLDLRNAVPFRPIPVEGREDGLRIVLADSPRGGDPLTLTEVLYQVEPTTQGQQLTRTSISLLTGEEKKDLLLEEALKIQFFYPYKGEEGKLLWRESWEASAENGEFPKWVKAEIVVTGEDPPLVQIFALPRGTLAEERREETP